MQTLPQLVREIGGSLDVMRSLVRRNPTLRAMGTLFGPCRVYSPDEVSQLKAAYAARERAKAATA